MRGYGDSDKPAGLDDYKMSQLVNDIKEIIEALGTHVSLMSRIARSRTHQKLCSNTKRNSLHRVNVFYNAFFPSS
jgi:hypothetical protein